MTPRPPQEYGPTDARSGGTRSRRAATLLLALALVLGVGCSRGGRDGDKPDGSVRDAGAQVDAAVPDLGTWSQDASLPVDLRAPSDLATPADLGVTPDLATPDLATPDLATPPDLGVRPDLATPPDLAVRPDLAMPPDLATPDLATGPITGGPCLSGSSGATAFRVRWYNSGGRAVVDYEVHGLPDKTRWKVGVYGYGFGFMPQFADPFLGPGGLQLDGSSFIDVELSTAGVSSIRGISLSVFGRSYSTGASGSFNWITSTGGGSTPLNFVSNVTPYKWYVADATPDLDPNDGRILMRIKAGGSSGSLVVNRLELCIDGR